MLQCVLLLQYVAVCVAELLQYVAACSSVLRCDINVLNVHKHMHSHICNAIHCSTLQHTATPRNTPQHAATHALNVHIYVTHLHIYVT